MTKLKYTFTNDILFKILFTQYQDLLKRLVAELLAIPYESIVEFLVNNSEIPPDVKGEKFCSLDIKMAVNGQRVDLEIQSKMKKTTPNAPCTTGRVNFPPHWTRVRNTLDVPIMKEAIVAYRHAYNQSFPRFSRCQNKKRRSGRSGLFRCIIYRLTNYLYKFIFF